MVRHKGISSTKLYAAVHKRLISLRSPTDRVAIRRVHGVSRPLHFLPIAVFLSSKPARGAGVPHGDRAGAQLSPQPRQCISLVTYLQFNAYNESSVSRQAVGLLSGPLSHLRDAKWQDQRRVAEPQQSGQIRTSCS